MTAEKLFVLVADNKGGFKVKPISEVLGEKTIKSLKNDTHFEEVAKPKAKAETKKETSKKATKKATSTSKKATTTKKATPKVEKKAESKKAPFDYKQYGLADEIAHKIIGYMLKLNKKSHTALKNYVNWKVNNMQPDQAKEIQLVVDYYKYL